VIRVRCVGHAIHDDVANILEMSLLRTQPVTGAVEHDPLELRRDQSQHGYAYGGGPGCQYVA
jgi:hypothetical protein